MNMFIVWVILFGVVSLIGIFSLAKVGSWSNIILRMSPFLLFIWFVLFSEYYIKSNIRLYSEIYEKGNLKELSTKIKESKEYNEYKFQRDWEEKESNGN